MTPRVIGPAVVVAACVLAAPRASVAQLTGTLDAQLTLTTACGLVGSNGTSGLDFGALDFGTQPATFSGVLTAQAAGGSGNTRIVCSADVTDVTIKIDGGNNAGQGGSIGVGTRALDDGSGGYVPYEVYSTAGTASPYPIGGAGRVVSIAVPGQPLDLPIFGRVNKTSPNALAAGSYDDTLQVTIEF